MKTDLLGGFDALTTNPSQTLSDFRNKRTLVSVRRQMDPRAHWQGELAKAAQQLLVVQEKAKKKQPR